MRFQSVGNIPGVVCLWEDSFSSYSTSENSCPCDRTVRCDRNVIAFVREGCSVLRTVCESIVQAVNEWAAGALATIRCKN